MKTVIAAAAALGGLMTLGLGVSNAEPHVQITENNGAYSQWNCQQGDDGLYYLFLST